MAAKRRQRKKMNPRKKPRTRPHEPILLDDKLVILAEIEAGTSIKRLAKNMGRSPSTIRGIKKNKAKIMKAWEDDFDMQRMTLKEAMFPDLEKELYEWVMFVLLWVNFVEQIFF